VADEALDRLLAYSWPGNIRELRNVLERAMLLGRGAPRVLPAHLPAEVRAAVGGPSASGGGGAGGERHVPRTLEEVEREHIERTLRAHNANRTHAAKELGISRATLIKKIKQYALDGRKT
jgi:transcriptional regulator with PAS, ATPase and Fis domain